MTPDKPYFAKSLRRLGEVWYSMGKYGKAVETFKKELRIRQDFTESGMSEFLRCKLYIAKSYSLMDMSKSVIDTLSGILSEFQETFTQDSDELKSAYVILGRAHRLTGAIEVSGQYLTKAVSITQELDLESPLLHFRVHIEMAWLHSAQKKYKAAQRIFRQIISVGCEDNRFVAFAHYGTGRIYKINFNHEKALYHLSTSISLFKKSYRHVPRDMAQCALLLAGLYETQSDWLSGIRVSLQTCRNMKPKDKDLIESLSNTVRKLSTDFLEMGKAGNAELSRGHIEAANALLSINSDQSLPEDACSLIMWTSQRLIERRVMRHVRRLANLDARLVEKLLKDNCTERALDYGNQQLAFYEQALGTEHEIVTWLRMKMPAQEPASSTRESDAED